MRRISDRLAALLLAALYGLAGGLWIFYSDRFFAAISRDSAQLTAYQTWKGWGYVFVSTLLVLGLIRLAQRHRWLHEREARRLNRLLTMRSEVSQAIVRTRGTPALFDAACEIAVRDGGYNLAWIARLDASSGNLQVESHAGTDGGVLAAINQTPDARVGQTQAMQSRLMEGRAFVCPDLHLADFSCAWRDRALAQGFSGVLALPVRPFNRVEAVIGFFTASPDRFDDREVELLEELARDLGFSLAYAAQELQRSQAEAAMHQGEARFRATFEQAAVGIAHVAPDGSWLRVNQKLCDIVGYSREEMLDRSFQDITHPEDLHIDLAHVQRLLRGEAVTYSIEKRYLRKDGTPVWIDLTVSLVRDDKGDPDYFISVIEDVQRRRQSEDQARLFRRLLDNVRDGIYVYRPNSTVPMDVNEAACRMLGYDRAELCSMDVTQFADFRPDEDRWSSQIDTVMRTGHCLFEDRHVRKDGRAIPVEVSISQVRDAGEAYMVTVIRDIADRKQSERALRESEARLRTVFNAIADAIVQADPERRIVMANPAFTRIFGYEAHEVIGRTTELLYADPADYAELGRQIYFSGHSPSPALPYQIRYRRKDGTEFWAETVGVGIEGSDGSLVGLLGLHRDVSERRMAEQALHQSEERLQQAVIVAGLGLFDHDLLTDTLHWSARQREIHAWRDDDPPSLAALIESIVPEDRAAFIDAVRRCHEPGGAGTFAVEYRIRLDDGNVRWLSSRGRTFFDGEDGGGHPVRTIGAELDITSAKLAEQALRENEERFRTLIEQAADAFFVHDGDGRFRDVNRLACESLGYSREELLRMNVIDVERDFDLARAQEIWLQLPIGQSARVYGHHRRKNGTSFPVEISVSACYVGGQRLNLALVRDITERLRADEAMRNLNADLENRVLERTAELRAANAELDSFAYAVSHDLRAPLRAMNGFSQALIEDYAKQLDGQAHVYLDQIIRASRTMSDLIDGLLQLSRHTRGVLRRDRVDISTLSQRVLAEYAHMEPQRRVTWQIEPGLEVRGDPRMIEAALRNLLANAWKYTSHVEQANIRVFAEQEGDEKFFCIEDNGAGFDMAHSGKLFQPFQRLHRQDEFPGLGIGLATVQRIVNRHGGRLRARSEPGRGAMFSFSLPNVVDTAQEVE